MKRWHDAALDLRHERAHLILTIEHEVVRGVTPAMLDMPAPFRQYPMNSSVSVE